MTKPSDVNPWPKVLGPCYTTESLQRELGMTEQEVADAARELRVLRLTTSDGVDVFPAFQVRAGQVVAGLGDVLRELARGPNVPLMWAQWLNAPIERAGGAVHRRIEELAAGKRSGIVREARNTAAAWLGDQPSTASNETNEIRFRASSAQPTQSEQEIHADADDSDEP